MFKQILLLAFVCTPLSANAKLIINNGNSSFRHIIIEPGCQSKITVPRYEQNGNLCHSGWWSDKVKRKCVKNIPWWHDKETTYTKNTCHIDWDDPND